MSTGDQAMTTPDASGVAVGRDLDLRVAQVVMGWTRPMDTPVFGEVVAVPPTASGLHHRVPNYSTDPAAAWLVVEAMRAKGYGYEVSGPRVVTTRQTECEARFFRNGVTHLGRAATMPEAVSRAALSALAAGEEKRA